MGGIKGNRDTTSNDAYAGSLLFYTSQNGSQWTQALKLDSSQNATFAGNISMNATHASTRSSGLHLDSTAGHNWYIHPDSNGNMGFNYNDSASDVLLLDANLNATFGGHILPSANDIDLGSSSSQWRNIYTSDLHLNNLSKANTYETSDGETVEGHGNDVDNTTGSWTIQEGNNDLFLINRLNGKKYKFNLTEIT
jgi:hypothetical protein